MTCTSPNDTDTSERTWISDDNTKIAQVLGRLSSFRYTDRSEPVSLLDEDPSNAAVSGDTLRLRIAADRTPHSAILAVSTCWKRGTGRQLTFLDTAPQV